MQDLIFLIYFFFIKLPLQMFCAEENATRLLDFKDTHIAV